MDDLIQLDIDEPKLQTNSLGTDDGQDEQSMDDESDSGWKSQMMHQARRSFGQYPGKCFQGR